MLSWRLELAHATVCSWRKRRKSSRLMKFTCDGSVVSADDLYALPVSTELRPRHSPCWAMRVMRVLPSPDEMLSLTAPRQRTKTRRGGGPAAYGRAPSG